LSLFLIYIYLLLLLLFLLYSNRLGLPGCVGSMDCTHISWHKCPVQWTNLMTGASGKPTISFQVVVDHNRKVTHCSQWFYGTWNDKMITTQVRSHCNI
jgi:hypothetical protein